MKEEIKVGDLVEWRTCHAIKSCVKAIIPSRGNKNVMVYRLENNCTFFKNEIKKVKSMKKKLYFSTAIRRKLAPFECVGYYFPEKSKEESDFILWEKTCFPFDTDIWLTQLYNLYLESIKKES